MEFYWPALLYFLLLVPFVVTAYVWSQRRRRRYALRYSSILLLSDAGAKGPGIRRHVPPALFILGLSAMLFGLSRPYTTVTLPSLDRTVILAIDVSGSMRADDLKPNRLTAAKSAAQTFVERQQPNTRVGIVSFSGGAFLVQAPTTEKEAAIAAINRLTTQRATAIGLGILVSLDAIAEMSGADLPPAQSAVTPMPRGAASSAPTPGPRGEFVPAIIVLLTDGQNTTGPLPLEAAQVAVSRGVRVFTIGVGTTRGATIGPPPGGGGGFGSGGGFRTMLDETTLRQVAKMTDAKYFHATNEQDLHEIYDHLDRQLVFKPQQIEVTALFTSAAAGLLLLGGVLSLLWFNRLP